MRSSTLAPLVAVLLTAQHGHAITIHQSSVDSVKDACKTVAANLMAYYNGNEPGETPGLLPPPYYWWEAGLMFDSLVNYWALTGDDQYVQLTREALLWQTGDDDAYMPANQTNSLGNDDQSTWALAAMTAAERGFPMASSQKVSWVQLAQNVFDTQVSRWDDSTCNGGLRWQIFRFNTGYNYKNTISTGQFVELASRLGRYTANQTYYDWAHKGYKWLEDVGLVTDKGIFDGTDVSTNCGQVNHIEWTNNYGLVLTSAASLANFKDASDAWTKTASDVLTRSMKGFAPEGIITEVACASQGNCDTDQLAFRATYARGLANLRNAAAADSTELVDTIHTIIDKSTVAAAASCTGGDDGTTCGSSWTGKYDGSKGVGQDLSTLELFLAGLPAVKLQTMNTTNDKPTTSPSSSATAGTSPSATAKAHTNGAGALGSSLVTLLGLAAFAAVFSL